MNPLYTQLINDIHLIGLPIDFLLTFKDFSKSYHGRYVVNAKNIILYTKDEEGKLLPYKQLLRTLIHEAVHHYQWYHEDNFVRQEGVMHNADFWIKYHHCLAVAKKLIAEGVIECEED